MVRDKPNRFAPRSVNELSDVVRDSMKPVIFGVGKSSREGHPTPFRKLSHDLNLKFITELATKAPDEPLHTLEPLYEAYTVVETGYLSEIIDYSAADQVIRVGAGIVITGLVLHEEDGSKTELTEGHLQDELRKYGQCLPFASTVRDTTEDYLLVEDGGTVGRGIALNRPHCLQIQCGSWRDWVLGMTLVLADGSIVKVGSKAVKNVAGYDIQKLIVGSYDSLAIIVDVTLRTFPVQALPKPSVRLGPGWQTLRKEHIKEFNWRQRVLRTDFENALFGVGDNLLYADEASCTLWCLLETPEQELPRYPGDWVIRSGCGEKNVQITNPTQIRLMKRAKEIFDPSNKLNPGEWGFM